MNFARSAGPAGATERGAGRRSLRRAVELPCEIVTRHLDEPLLYWATNLTPFGLWIDTRFPMQSGDVVVVCFRPAVWWPGRELMLFAEVVRATTTRGETGMGLEFLDADEHERRALTAWLRGRPPPLPKRRPRVYGRRLLPKPRCAA
jgi:hypothetical protein